MNTFLKFKSFSFLLLIIIIIIILIVIFTGYQFLSVRKSSSINLPQVNKTQELIHPGSHSINMIASNQWYSSIYKEFPSQPLFALPVAFKISSNGLSFSYPHINATPNTVFASYNEDFTVGIIDPLTKPSFNDIGDWHISLTQYGSKNKETFFSYTLAHGVPYTTISTNSTKFLITFPHPFTLFNQEDAQPATTSLSTKSFVINTNDNFYIFSLPQNTLITQTKNQMFFKSSGKVFIGLLDKKGNYKIFQQIANNVITGTSSTPVIQNGKLLVNYVVVTNGEEKPLLALYPHQYDALTQKMTVLGTYRTLRGELNLIQADQFQTAINLITPQAVFAPLADSHPDFIRQIQSDIADLMKQGPPASKDYFFGTWLGKADNLLLLADSQGLISERQKLLDYLKPIFRDSLANFVYDKNKNSVIAKYPEFGNEKLNDHHFHYGYYIRTAAVLAKFDQDIISQNKDIINMMVEDIANINRSSMRFPYIRNFDVYESHSWADGFANFGDGNNQESSSEAINAWYGIYLWGLITNNTKLQTTALYLYNSEIQGAKYYWFNIKGIYPPQYEHKIASIVWGGKVDFSTWFSAETNMKYGIQLLPFTPGSIYLANFNEFEKYNNDFHNSRGDEKKEWGDLFLIWKSFYNPREAIKFINTPLKTESNTPRSLFLYYLYKNNQQ